jgi:hypothetical protein
MALGIGLWVRDTALKLRQEGIELTKAAIGQINRNKIDQTPVFKQKQAQVAQQYWQMSSGNAGYGQKNIEDIRWLLG